MASSKNEEANTKSSSKSLGVFITVVSLIALFAVFGENGLVDVFKLKEDRDEILESNKALEEENQRVREEIERLQNDDRYIADIAKKELGMVGSDEVIYVLEDKGSK